MKKNKKIIVLGGGAAGIMAAITAKQAGGQVTILEHTDNVGRKLLSTGNGRCNFTNTNLRPDAYHCDTPGFYQQVLKDFTPQDSIRFFMELGLYSKNVDGYMYPHTNQAISMVQVLKNTLDRLEIPVEKNIKINHIEEALQGLLLHGENKSYSCDALILATGSKAAPFTGSDGSGYLLSKQLGHSIKTLAPGLVPLYTLGDEESALAGIRIHSAVTLQIDNQEFSTHIGELQLTKKGISGIPVFQISGEASKALIEEKDVKVHLDFMPDFSSKNLELFIMNRVSLLDEPLYKFFQGLLPDPVAKVILKRIGIRSDIRSTTLSKEDWNTWVQTIKKYTVPICGYGDFKDAQICVGGVSCDEIDANTLASKLSNNIYFAGEIIDVDGICGGYNLHWAFASGRKAGKEATK